MLQDIIAAVRFAERFLGPDDDWVEDDRRILFEAAQLLFGRWHDFVYEKGDRDYLTTAKATPNDVERALAEEYQRNLISARKYRVYDNNKNWAVGSWVIDDGDVQHHVYLFDRPDGMTDIYTHTEDSVSDPEEHLSASGAKGMAQESSTPGEVFNCLDRAGIEYAREKL